MCARRTEQPATWNAGEKEEGRGKAVDRFRHASFVGGTSFISTRPGGEGGWDVSLPTLSLSLPPFSLSVAFVLDEKKRRQIPRTRGQPLDRRRRRFCASRASPRTALFQRGRRERGAKP